MTKLYEREEKKSEYVIASGSFLSLVGKRAKIKDKAEGYTRYLWNKEGVIEVWYNQLFLKFDEPLGPPTNMSGVYLSEDCFELTNTATYVNVSKPLMFRKFEKFLAPMGWIRIDILKRKIKDNNYAIKFTTEELKLIEETI